MQLNLGKKLRDIIGDSFGAEIAEFQLEKAIQSAKDASTRGNAGPQSLFFDPMSLFMGREWLVKRGVALTYNDLREMSKNPIIGSIIQTRVNQVASFMQPQVGPYDTGYRIVHNGADDTETSATRSKLIANWLYTCGEPGYGEPLLEQWSRKFMRDALILDQACSEIIYARNGLPSYLMCVDGATIRRLRRSLDFTKPPDNESPFYCQVYQEQPVAQYNYNQLIFGIRNPHTDLKLAGYGMSELELLLRIVTAMINTERFNTGLLSQGGTSKGIMVVKGDAGVEEMNTFRRDFREAIRNAANFWRPPVLQVAKEADINWVELDRANRDMEYASLFDFLVKQACGVYQISPEEINWSIGASGATTVFQSKNDDKLNYSKSKGLKPALTFIANQLNLNVINQFSPGYRMECVGLDQDRATDSTIRMNEVQNYKTVNQARAELGWKPIPGGDIILNPVYLQFLQGGGDQSGQPVGWSVERSEVAFDEEGSIVPVAQEES